MSTLWLSPTSTPAARFRSLIEHYSAELDTASFAPHVTLVSGWPEVGAIETLLSGITSITLPIRGVSTSQDFFRCVVIELEPTEQLLTARRDACRLIGVSDTGGYRPHLSLVYGELPSMERERVRAEVAGDLPKSIRLDRLDVVSTGGAIEQWNVIAGFPLPPAM